MKGYGVNIFLLFIILTIGKPFDCTGLKNEFVPPEPIISLGFFCDTAHISFDSIRSLSTDKFEIYKGEKLFRDNTYWLKIVVDFSKTENSENYIHFNSFISNIFLYQPDGKGGYSIKQGGSLVPMAKRSAKGYLKDKVPFSLSGSAREELYMRISTKIEKVYDLTQVEVISTKKYSSLSKSVSSEQSFFLGIIAILFFFNVMLFVLTQDRLYMFYFLYLLSLALYFTCHFQILEKYVLFNHPRLDLALASSLTISETIYIWFFHESLKNEGIPWRNKIRYFAVIISSICIAICILFFIDYHMAVIVNDFFSLVNGLFVFAMFLILIRKVSKTVKVILVGSLVMASGGIIATMLNFMVSHSAYFFIYQWGAIIELILFTIAINFIYSNERSDKMKALLEKSILEARQLKKEKEARKLNKEIDLKNRDLTTKAAMISQKEITIKYVIQELSRIVKKETIEVSVIKELISKMKADQNHNIWEEFEIHFKEVHPKFYTELNKKVPGLTANERILCAFLKLNMTTKDIAAITGKSIESIDMMRSRLRKKLDMKNNDNLYAEIASIGQ